VFLLLRNILILAIKQQSLINLLAEIRTQSSVLLPIGHSFIPFDILLTVVKNVEADTELTVKALFASLPYSDMGIRYHFDKLVKTGWIELHNGDTDTRIKRVKPTEKLSKRFLLLSNQLSHLLQLENS
jgi:DNA-binding MarR family transcriptional regulator